MRQMTDEFCPVHLKKHLRKRWHGGQTMVMETAVSRDAVFSLMSQAGEKKKGNHYMSSTTLQTVALLLRGSSKLTLT